mmetsp:Transcript_94093/g.303983  ORF Transcript_94093/g.303983 Transcript_94093/m.303983 type:complete len:575 (+) Transcript_94093:47-1771(+)
MERTSTHAMFRLRCSQRNTEGLDRSYPVKLVVFDFDETLTLVTFMVSEEDEPNVQEYWTRANFESPWVPGSRLAKLRRMLSDLAEGADGRRRTLAILTANRSGVAGVLAILKVAKLAQYFSAIWALPWRVGKPSGAYQVGGEWKCFEPPKEQVRDHKADVLCHVAKHPAAWFPQLNEVGAETHKDLCELKLEGIVLVDDQRANFQSDSGAQVLRYCKVMRYDARYRSFGLMKNMGGIGAHNDLDYQTLKIFVEDPRLYRETLQVQCFERHFEGQDERHPVSLVVFDFDETLTLGTFMPSDPAFTAHTDWIPSRSGAQTWNEDTLLEYNFESPYVEGNRVAKLRDFLAGLAEHRTLAILTRNESGVIAVLNLLRIAKLAEYFSAIWTIPWRHTTPTGAYQEGGQWRCFDPPVLNVQDHKADVLLNVVQNPAAWFPQLTGDEAGRLRGNLLHMQPHSLVLIDDERANFSNWDTHAEVLRYCKVARYDDVYRECGPLNQMGGIGAHSDEDYENLARFIEQPWEFPCGRCPAISESEVPAELPMEKLLSVPRSFVSEELCRSPRRRHSSSACGTGFFT